MPGAMAARATPVASARARFFVLLFIGISSLFQTTCRQVIGIVTRLPGAKALLRMAPDHGGPIPASKLASRN